MIYDETSERPEPMKNDPDAKYKFTLEEEEESFRKYGRLFREAMENEPVFK